MLNFNSCNSLLWSVRYVVHSRNDYVSSHIMYISEFIYCIHNIMCILRANKIENIFIAPYPPLWTTRASTDQVFIWVIWNPYVLKSPIKCYEYFHSMKTTCSCKFCRPPVGVNCLIILYSCIIYHTFSTISVRYAGCIPVISVS